MTRATAWILATAALLVSASACGDGSDGEGDGGGASGGSPTSGVAVSETCPDELALGPAAAAPGAPPVRWRQDLSLGDAPVLGTLTEGVVAVGGSVGTADVIVGIDLVSGEARWCAPGELSAPSADAAYATEGPILARAQLSDGSRRVAALDPTTGTERWAVDGPLAIDVAGNDEIVVVAGLGEGSTLTALSLADGTERWSYEPNGDGLGCGSEEVIAVGDAPDVVGLRATDGSEVYRVTGSLDCLEGTGTFVATDLDDGTRVVHDTDTGTPQFDLPDDAEVRHVVDGDLAIVTDNPTGDLETLTAHRLDGSGGVAWTLEIDTSTPDGLYGNEFVGDRYAIVVNDALRVVDLRSGTVLTEVTVPPGPGVDAIVGDVVVLTYLDSDPPQTLGVDASTGQVRWQLDGASPFSALEDTVLVIAQEAAVVAVDVAG